MKIKKDKYYYYKRYIELKNKKDIKLKELEKIDKDLRILYIVVGETILERLDNE